MRQQQRTNDSGSMTMRNVKFKNCFSGFSHTSFVIICFLVFLCQLPINFYDRGSYNLSLWLQTKWCARGWVSSLNFRILQIFIYWFMFFVVRESIKSLFIMLLFFKFKLCFVVSSSAKKFYRGLDGSSWIVLLSLRYRRLSVEKGKIICRKKTSRPNMSGLKSLAKSLLLLSSMLKNGRKIVFLILHSDCM